MCAATSLQTSASRIARGCSRRGHAGPVPRARPAGRDEARPDAGLRGRPGRRGARPQAGSRVGPARGRARRGARSAGQTCRPDSADRDGAAKACAGSSTRSTARSRTCAACRCGRRCWRWRSRAPSTSRSSPRRRSDGAGGRRAAAARSQTASGCRSRGSAALEDATVSCTSARSLPAGWAELAAPRLGGPRVGGFLAALPRRRRRDRAGSRERAAALGLRRGLAPRRRGRRPDDDVRRAAPPPRRDRARHERPAPRGGHGASPAPLRGHRPQLAAAAATASS